MKTIKYDLQDGIATLTFDEPGSPVNTMSDQWTADMAEAAQQVQKDKDTIKGIVLASAKSTFFVGADLKALLRMTPGDGPKYFAQLEQIKKSFRVLETLGKPVVSCINGTALGGGFELALVGHHRIAVDDDAIQLGFPEINLGLLPGGGGITKAVRLLGLQAAQPYLLECKLFTPREGVDIGLVDALVKDASQLRAAALEWIAQHPQSQQPWDAKDYKMPGGGPSNPKVAGMLVMAPAMLRKKTRGLYPAPEAALAAMVEGAMVDFDTAMRIESRYLAKMAVSPVGHNMVSLFFDKNTARKAAREAKDPAAAEQARQRFIGRLQQAYAEEVAAMHAEGVPAAVVRNASFQAGMPAEADAAPDMKGAASTAMADKAATALDNKPSWSLQDLIDRLLWRQAIEAARCLADGTASSAAEANVASVTGAGFPAWTGGAMQLIYGTGIDAFTARASALAGRYGNRFALEDKTAAAIKQHSPRR